VPREKEGVFYEIMGRAHRAASTLKTWGCGTAIPTVQEFLIEGYALRDALTEEEKTEFYQKYPKVERAVSDRRIRCDQIDEILAEAERGIDELLKRRR